MTAEFGPRNVDLSTAERVAATSTKYLLATINRAVEDGTIRFNDQTATLSISGESEHPGDPYNRGGIARMVVVSNAMIPAVAMTLLGELPIQAGIMGAPSVVSTAYALIVLLPLAIFGVVNVYGSLGLLDKVDVIDHTTPKPDDRIEELADGYVDGELDREEFEREVETIFEREAGR